MGLNTINYALSKTYTDQSISGISGVLAGKNCVIDKIEDKNGAHYVTFKWTADDGTVKTQTMVVEDGDPIYTWYPNTTYEVDDIVVYDGSLYRCTVKHTSSSTFDTTKFDALISTDGNYSLHENYGELNQTLKPSDRKMAYCINDYTNGSMTYKAGYYVWTTDTAHPNGYWQRCTPPVLDRFTEVPIKDATNKIIGYELYFDSKRVITEDVASYRVVNTYANIDTTATENTMFFVENATGVGTTSVHYSGNYLFDATAKTIEYVDKKEDVNIDFSTDYTPIIEG